MTDSAAQSRARAKCSLPGCGHALSRHNELGYCQSPTTPDRQGACTCDGTIPWASQEPEMPAALTAEEQAAIKALERLAARWPQSLTLFSAAGSLAVIRTGSYTPSVPFEALAFTWIDGIPNDGGDP